MLRCSHGLPFETKCQECFQDAMKQYRPVPAVVPVPTEAQRDAFWLNVYGQLPNQEPKNR